MSSMMEERVMMVSVIVAMVVSLADSGVLVEVVYVTVIVVVMVAVVVMVVMVTMVVVEVIGDWYGRLDNVSILV